MTANSEVTRVSDLFVQDAHSALDLRSQIQSQDPMTLADISVRISCEQAIRRFPRIIKPRFLESKYVAHCQLGNLLHQAIVFDCGNLVEWIIGVDISLDGVLDPIHFDLAEIMFQVRVLRQDVPHSVCVGPVQ